MKEAQINVLIEFFAERMRSFALLSEISDLKPWERKLASKATYSAYNDLLALGQRPLADSIRFFGTSTNWN